MSRDYTSAQHVLNAINTANHSLLTEVDVSFGMPIATPLESTNTELKVSPTKGVELHSVEIKYNRWNLADLFQLDAQGMHTTVIYGVGVRNTYDLLQRINTRFGTVFIETEFVMESIDSSVLPVTYQLKSDRSLAVLGNVEFLLVSDEDDSTRTPMFSLYGDLSYPTAPTVTYNTLCAGVTADEELLYSVGISGRNMTTVDNEDLQLALGAQHHRDPNPIASVEGLYSLAGPGTEQGWSVPVSIELWNNPRGELVTELYEITLELIPTDDPTHRLVFELQYALGQYAFVSGLATLPLTRTSTAEGYVLQGYLNARLTLPYANADIQLAGSIPIGEFTFVLKADPIDSLVVTPMVNEIKVVVTETA